MKKHGIINAQLAGLIAGLGHKDKFMVVDGGMPIPPGVEIVDLALVGGVPTFEQVMDAILDETCVEHYTLATEIEQYNPQLKSYIEQVLPDVDHSYVSHVELKELSKQVKFVIRTGEFTPYPNILLRAGVSFAV